LIIQIDGIQFQAILQFSCGEANNSHPGLISVLFTEVPCGRRTWKKIVMEVLYADCAGLDVRKHTVVACARRAIAGKAAREVRTFKTTAGGLLALSEWLCSQGIAHIAMEAAGVCRKPAWNILSGGDFTLALANAAHVKNVPGRKTGVNGATRARRGANKATGAAAASILTAAYHMIANGTFYKDPGAGHFERRTKPSHVKSLVAKLQNLGYQDGIKPLTA
jgi:hypothetical protein